MPTYAELSRGNPESPLVKRAVTFCKEKGVALDLGAGSLRNAKHLLAQGFSVVAVDKDPVLVAEATQLSDPRLTTIPSTYEDFTFPAAAYDLCIAINSLQFENPNRYEAVFGEMITSLKKEGILAMTFFGSNDEWAKSRKDMSFHDKEEILQIADGLEMISLGEREEDSKTISGIPKHWHIFSLIARKP